MGLGVTRTTEPLRFDVGIGSAGYADIIESPVAGEPQKALLPGTTTVTQAIDELFPTDRSVRTPGGFAEAARSAVGSLRDRKTPACDRAAHEIENLLADADLLERCRMALLET